MALPPITLTFAVTESTGRREGEIYRPLRRAYGYGHGGGYGGYGHGGYGGGYGYGGCYGHYG